MRKARSAAAAAAPWTAAADIQLLEQVQTAVNGATYWSTTEHSISWRRLQQERRWQHRSSLDLSNCWTQFCKRSAFGAQWKFEKGSAKRQKHGVQLAERIVFQELEALLKEKHGAEPASGSATPPYPSSVAQLPVVAEPAPAALRSLESPTAPLPSVAADSSSARRS